MEQTRGRLVVAAWSRLIPLGNSSPQRSFRFRNARRYWIVKFTDRPFSVGSTLNRPSVIARSLLSTIADGVLVERLGDALVLVADIGARRPRREELQPQAHNMALARSVDVVFEGSAPVQYRVVVHELDVARPQLHFVN
jgi:hypothetical protein